MELLFGIALCVFGLGFFIWILMGARENRAEEIEAMDDELLNIIETSVVIGEIEETSEPSQRDSINKLEDGWEGDEEISKPEKYSPAEPSFDDPSYKSSNDSDNKEM